MVGEDLTSMTMAELRHLEQQLEVATNRVRSRKVIINSHYKNSIPFHASSVIRHSESFNMVCFSVYTEPSGDATIR